MTWHGPLWLMLVLIGFQLAGFVGVCWVVAGWMERAADWWHRRRRSERPRGISDDCWYGTHEDCDGCACRGCGHEDEDELRAAADEEMAYFDGPPLELAPERTWEQMTSHQLPLETQLAEELEQQGWFDADVQARLRAEHARVAPSLLGSRQATAHFRRLEKARKRRFMVVSAEIWRAYAALGLEGTGFTRAQAAQVRELTP